MGIIQIKKNDSSNFEFFKLDGFINEQHAGCLTGNLNKTTLSLKATFSAKGFNEEDQYNLKYGLIRFALEMAKQHKVEVIIDGSSNTQTPTTKSLKQIEDLFSIFDSSQSTYEVWKINSDFSKEPLQNFNEYIRVPHGEVCHLTSRGTYILVQGEVEVFKGFGFMPFTPRETIKTGQYLVDKAIVAKATADLIKIPDLFGVKTVSEQTIPYSVSFYNSFLLSYILHALGDLGWFTYLQKHKKGSFCLKHTMQELKVQKEQLFYEMLRFLELAHFLHFDKTKQNYVCNSEFLDNIYKDFGYLQFLIHGYDTVLKELAPLVKGEKKYGKDIRKNMGLKLFNHFYGSYQEDIAQDLITVINQINPQHVAQIACGSALRLIQLCQDHPHIKATGLDLDPAVCEIARKNVAEAGLSDRITIIEGDVFDWAKKKHEDIDLVLLVEGVFHDFHHLSGGAKPLLTLLKNSIAENGTLLVEDQNVSNREENHFPLSIADGFEFLHTVMNSSMFTQDQYIDLFVSAGWHVHAIHGTKLAQDWMYILKNKKNEKDYLIEASLKPNIQIIENLNRSGTALAKIMADLISKKDEGQNDKFLLRSDPIYIRAKEAQKKYLDENLNLRLCDHLVNLILMEKKATTLIIMGMESNVLSLAIEEIIRKGFDTQDLHIVMIDPLQQELKLEVETLKQILQKHQKTLGSIITFAKPVQELSMDEWKQIGSLTSYHLVFANLSLHFIKEEEKRNSLFEQMAKLGNVRFWIRERELDLYTIKTLPERVSIAWDYFAPRYQQIAKLECPDEEKEILYKWYSLQVKDALNDQDTVACTQYCESGKKWLNRLVKAGFTTIELAAIPESSSINQKGIRYLDKGQAAFFTLIQCKNY